MCRILRIIDDLGKKMEIIDVEHTVGANGVNDPDDIRAVKALLHFIPRSYSHGKIRASFNSVGKEASWGITPTKMPSPYDGTTSGLVEVIKSFQNYANKMLSNYSYRVNVSGRIKPAKGYAVVGKNYSTIAALNVFANLGGTFGKTNYIDRIMDEYFSNSSGLAKDSDEEWGD